MKKILLIALIFLLALGITSNVSAQSSYLFSVDKEDVNVYWNADGSQSLDYVWVFTNGANSHLIDFVDVGMPNGNFDISNAAADVNGNAVDVSTSDYQGSGTGFAVVMGSQTIGAGASGTVHVHVENITGVLYPDSGDSKYASADFAPTYFGSQYLSGTTALTMTFHLPPNMKETEPRWHAAPNGFPSEPQAAYDAENRVTYTWFSPSASASEQYTFGASFPKTYIPDTAIVTAPAFDFGGLISSIIGNLFIIFWCGFFVFMFIGMPIFSAVQGQRRKLQYMSPKVSIEGHGIKRGLTAVESAALMETPLDKVMTMILFGAIKKNAASVKTRDPLELNIVEPSPEGLNDYEISFLKAFKISDKRARQKGLQDMMVALIKSVAEKMRGFSRAETVDYYKSIMEKAWQQIEAANTPEVKSQKLDEALEWTMLDKNYDDRTRRVFSGPMYAPTWWGSYDPTYRSTPTSGGKVLPTNIPSSSGRQGLPGADFAASMVTGVQTFSQSVIGNVSAFTEKVTGVTNPPPPPSRSSGGHSGGGGCACACAGCACACAGGGR